MIPGKGPSHYRTGAALLLALFLAAPLALAASSPIPVSHDFDLDWSIVGNAGTHGHGASFDSGDEQSSSVRYLFSPQVTSRLLLHLGAEWQRFSFSVSDKAPIPGTLQEISTVLGLDWQFSDKWLIQAQVQPGFYSDFDDLSWKDVDAPLRLDAAYLVDPDLQWFFGLRVDLRSHYPVIPAVGLRWKFADQWTLDAVVPRLRLEYERDDRFQGYLGANIKAGTFRLADHFGKDRGVPQLDHASLDLFEVRVGPGISWKIRPDIIVEAEAGYMVYRLMDLGHDVIFHSDPAPYIQLALRLRF